MFEIIIAYPPVRYKQFHSKQLTFPLQYAIIPSQQKIPVRE